VREKKLAGATYVLGCYGGEDTFSDLVVYPELINSDPQQHHVLNNRLGRLRDTIFMVANDIAAASAQPQSPQQ